MSKKYKVWIFWALMLIGALLVVSQSSYSDGDDAFFLSVYEQYGIWRVSVLALSDLGGKNVGRGVCVSCIPARARLLACGKCRDAGASADGGAALVRKGGRDCVHSEEAIGPCAAAVGGYFLMNIMTVGYAAVWVNGSIFYTWCFTCGIWALMPFADAVSAKPGKSLR